MSFYSVVRNIVAAAVPLFLRIKAEGLENIPNDRGYILCCNHISFLDPIVLAVKIKKQCHFMGKKELFKNPVLSSFFRALGAFPVDRGKGDTQAVDHAVQLVRDNKVFAIFPEGTRSKTGALGRLKSGAVVIASRTGGDILPCVIKKGKRRFLRKTITVKFGNIIPNSALDIEGNAPSQIKSATRLLAKTFEDLLEDIND